VEAGADFLADATWVGAGLAPSFFPLLLQPARENAAARHTIVTIRFARMSRWYARRTRGVTGETLRVTCCLTCSGFPQ